MYSTVWKYLGSTNFSATANSILILYAKNISNPIFLYSYSSVMFLYGYDIKIFHEIFMEITNSQTGILSNILFKNNANISQERKNIYSVTDIMSILIYR